MKNIEKRISIETLKELRCIGELSMVHQSRAYAVGGWVRDVLLKRSVVDLDIVVEGDGIALARQFASAMKGHVTAYPQFGTATVKLSDGRDIDFVGARKEQYPSPGVLPIVAPGSIEDDLFRRDFTINAMAMSIVPDDFGRIVDPYGGLEDLEKKRIRVLHDKSFQDDPTRILRAVRFEQRLGFRIEIKTLGLLKTALRRKAELAVKPPRYFEEFKKNLKEKNSLKNLQRLSALKALNFLGLSLNMRDIAPRIGAIALVSNWASKKLPDWSKENLWRLNCMALVHNAPVEKVKSVVERFNFSKIDRKKVIASLFLRAISDKLSVRHLSNTEAFAMLRPLSLEEVIFVYSLTHEKTACRRLQKYLLEWRHLKLQIKGEDLKAAGLLPGREYQHIFETVLSALVEGECATRTEQLKFLQSCVRK